MFDSIQFISSIPNADSLYHTSYRLDMVLISILTAIFASYAALITSSRVQQSPEPLKKIAWLGVSSFTMGIGVWAMHFIGMMSLTLPCFVAYSPLTTMISVLPGIIASIVALSITGKRNTGNLPLLISSMLLGSGIGAMHYMGMAAMHLAGSIRYDPALFFLSIIVAVGLSYIALRFRVSMKDNPRANAWVATIMGGAISCVHYISMSATYFIRSDTITIPPATIDEHVITVGIVVSVGLVALFTLAFSTISTHRDIAVSNVEFQQHAINQHAIISITDIRGNITHINDKFCEISGYLREELLGKNHRIVKSDVHSEEFFRNLWHTISNGNIWNGEICNRKNDGSLYWLFSTIVPRQKDTGVPGQYLSIHTDITERKLAEQRQQHQNRVLQKLASKAQLADILDTIARDVEAINPEMLCSILLLDDEGKHLRHAAAPSLPEFYNQAMDGVVIGLEVGSCGTAAFTGKRVIIEDIETHPWWRPFRDIAHQAGLGACWSEPILSGQGQVLGTFAIYHSSACHPSPNDLQLIEVEANLAALAIEKSMDEARLQMAASVFTHAHEGIAITNLVGTIVDINDTFTVITGYNREEVLGENHRILQSGFHSPEFYAGIWQTLIEENHWSGEIWNRHKNGEVYAEQINISAVHDAAGKAQYYVSMFTDITSMKNHQQQLEHNAHYDPLTNLPNRTLLANRLQHAIIQSESRNKSIAVVYLDLDGFKAVNDAYGHGFGDKLLITVSQRMQGALRDGDTLARIGGDEFVVVLVDLERPQECELVLTRLLQVASDPVTVDAQVLQVSASIGITLYPQDTADVDMLLRHADQAMYQAKQGGKNRYQLFDVKQDAAIKNQRESLENICRAFDQREFLLYYQPKVNMKTGQVIGAEALIRWQHPQRGLLLPADFLPIIENHAINLKLGEWVIDTALIQINEWRAMGLDIPVSVNVGAQQLQQQDFVSRLLALLAKHPDVKPCFLELEVLESRAINDTAEVSAIMHACRDIGIRFALDDFGTGYSSLTYLRRLQVDIIKVDQSFVRDMLIDSEDMAIVNGVIGLAAAFGRQVIAEGVETIAHGTQLLLMGCELAQGYGIARPMPAADLPNWVVNWKPDLAWTC